MNCAHAVLQSLLASVGLQETITANFVGADPALPTRYRVASASAGLLAALAAALEQICRMNNSTAQHISVSLEHAAAALRSNQYLRLNGAPPPNPWDDLAGFYSTKDARYIQLHTNFPHHRHGTVKLLGCADSREAVAAAIAASPAFPLEDALAAAGLCAAVARTDAEWLAHPQGQAVGSLPLLKIEKIGHSAVEPVGRGSSTLRPLKGLRCLDLSRVIAGPACTRTLAEYGAEVLRVDSPHLPTIESVDMDSSHGKRRAFADLDVANDHRQLTELIRRADVFAQAYRPGALAQRGFGPVQLATLRPGIVVLSLSAYGDAGPWAQRRGYDTLVQSACGIAMHQGADLGHADVPAHLPCSALDYITGFLGALGILVALLRRASEGGSYAVSVSLAQTAHWLMQLGRLPSDVSLVNCEPRVEACMQESKGPFGHLRFLAPVPCLSGTKPYFSSASASAGSSPLSWI